MSRQTSVRRAEDWELLEALELAIDDVADAMENLRGFEDFEEWFDTLDDLHSWMNLRREELEVNETADYNDQINELRKEYLRGVL